MDECIHAYPVASAYAEFEDGKKGQIVPGQYADIIVLPEDITKLSPANLLGVEVKTTIVGGQVVFENYPIF
jgi:hypothetical protein